MIIKSPRGAQLNRSHPLARGLVGCWLFNEGTGDKVFDLSGNGNQGTLTNMDPATDWVGGKDGWALDFDGVDDEVDVVDNPTLQPATSVTLFAVFNSHDISATSGWQALIRKERLSTGDESYALDISNDQLRFIVRNDSTYNAIQRTLTWINDRDYSVCGIFHGGETITLNRNGGEFDQTDTPTFTTMTYDASLLDLGRQTAAGTSLNGCISIAYVYNRALIAAEVHQLHLNPYQIFESGVSAGIFGTLAALGPKIKQFIRGR